MLGINYFDKSKFDMVECYNYETINVLNLLKQIKDFSYSINGTFKNVLQYENVLTKR